MNKKEETIIKPEKYICYIPRSDLKQFEPKRVAVYSRVSREGEMKHHSIKMQMKYLEQYVTSHPGWIFIGHYVDEGVTGTKLSRPAFNQLMEDARSGKIDIILTKTVSRFGRNIKAVLNTIRELKELDVTVIFEDEGLSTDNSEANFQLQYKGIQAEVESRQNSENQKWAIRNRFKRGIPNNFKTYGYKMVNHKLYVVPEEAEVIKKIYGLYLSGYGTELIAKTLNREGILSPKGTKWRQHVIHRILRNEQYVGDLLLQKWFITDHLTKTEKPNRGDLPQYLIENDHEAIIERDIFNQVQAEIKRREENHKEILARVAPMTTTKNTNTTATATSDTADESNPARVHKKSRPFKHLIYCASCDGVYKYKFLRNYGSNREVWVCRNYVELGKDYCENKAIPENILITITTEILLSQNLIKKDKKGNLPKLTNESLNSLIHKIIAYPNQTLEYHLTNGEIITRKWQFISRKHSWTKEMKEKARQQALARNAKKKEAEQGVTREMAMEKGGHHE